MGVRQGSPSRTVSHAIYHPLVCKLLLLVDEVHLKRFYEKKHDLHIWWKDNHVESLFSNTFQRNNIVVPFRFSWKRNVISGRCFVRCYVTCWYWFQCFNQSKPFFVFTFFQKFTFKVFNAYPCSARYHN